MTALNAVFYTNCCVVLILFAVCQEPVVALGVLCMLKLSMFLINDNKRAASSNTLERDKNPYAVQLHRDSGFECDARKNNRTMCQLYACDVIWECRMGQPTCSGVCCNDLRVAERRTTATQEAIRKVLDALYELIMS